MPRIWRAAAVLLLALFVLVVGLVALRGSASTISGRGEGISFSFSYRGLQRRPAPAGALALLDARRGGQVIAQIELRPLHLPAYGGDVIGIEPLIAANYMRAFAKRTPGVVVSGAGPTVVNGAAGYNFTYTRRERAGTYFGRVIFLTAPTTHPRRGLIVSLLAQPVLSGVIGHGAGALAGALYEPGQGGVGVLFQPSGLLSLPLATLRLSG